MDLFSCTPILISASLFSLHRPPHSDNSHPLCFNFLFLGLCLCITRCILTFTSHTPHAYFVHLPHVITRTPYVFVSYFWACVYVLLAAPSHLLHTHTCLLRTPPTCDSLAPLCLCFSFLGLRLCITRCTLTFTSCTPYVFVSLFGPVFYVHFMYITHYSCTLLLLFFSLLSFFCY